MSMYVFHINKVFILILLLHTKERQREADTVVANRRRQRESSGEMERDRDRERDKRQRGGQERKTGRDTEKQGERAVKGAGREPLRLDLLLLGTLK